MLVAAGASLTMRDSNGLTPMMIAFQVEDNDLATYLESMFTLIFTKCSMAFIFRIFLLLPHFCLAVLFKWLDLFTGQEKMLRPEFFEDI